MRPVWRGEYLAVQDAALAMILAGTVLALYMRPFGARDWQVAAAGAAAAWAIGPLGFGSGLRALGDSANIVAFFFGLMLLAAGAEAAGLYARAAQVIGRAGPERTRVAAVVILGIGITAVLSNDATPLVLARRSSRPAPSTAAQPGRRHTPPPLSLTERASCSR